MVESYGTWLLFQRLDDSSQDSDIPKNVPFAFAINNRNIEEEKNVERAILLLANLEKKVEEKTERLNQLKKEHAPNVRGQTLGERLRMRQLMREREAEVEWAQKALKQIKVLKAWYEERVEGENKKDERSTGTGSRITVLSSNPVGPGGVYRRLQNPYILSS